MNKIVLFLFLATSFCAKDKKTKQEKHIIVGNWYNFNDTTKHSGINYTETFFSSKEFSLYEDVLIPPYEYYLKGNDIFQLNMSKSDTSHVGKLKFLNKNTLKIIPRKLNGHIILKRVIDSNTLEDFVTQKIDEKTYYPSYLIRKSYWEKYGLLPENGDFENPPKQVE